VTNEQIGDCWCPAEVIAELAAERRRAMFEAPARQPAAPSPQEYQSVGFHFVDQWVGFVQAPLTIVPCGPAHQSCAAGFVGPHADQRPFKMGGPNSADSGS